MHISGIDYDSFNDAPGVCCVIYISGCTKGCKGCHNPDTHNPNFGIPLTKELINQINNEIDKRPYLKGLVLSGGDPMEHAKDICEDLIPYLHIPNGNLWCYSGCTLNEILADANMAALLSHCNGLTDGRFEIDKRDTTLAFRGSSNQKTYIKLNGTWTEWEA